MSYRYLLFLLILINYINCADTVLCGDKLKKDTCYLESQDYIGETKQRIIYYKKCPSNEECRVIEKSYIGFCIPKQTKLKEGEKCVRNFECEIGRCTNNECRPLSGDTTCTKDSECSYSTYCKGFCTNMYKEGEECDDKYDDRESITEVKSYCELGSLCAKVNGDKKKCVKAFSLENGNETKNRYLCKSGFIYNKI